jgi:hypothetical protein
VTEQAVPAQGGDDCQQMMAMLTSQWVSQTVRAVVDLREGSAANTTFRLVRACVALGLLTADADGRFASTPLPQTLGKDAPGSLRDLAVATTLPVHRRCREAMASGGRIAIIELVLGELSDPGFGAVMDMNMLAASPAGNAPLTSTTRCWQPPACGGPQCSRPTPRKASSRPSPPRSEIRPVSKPPVPSARHPVGSRVDRCRQSGTAARD